MCITSQRDTGRRSAGLRALLQMVNTEIARLIREQADFATGAEPVRIPLPVRRSLGHPATSGKGPHR